MISTRIAAALWLGLAATGAHAAQVAAKPCVPAADAEALFLSLAPDMLRQIGTKCAATLPATALIRRTGGPFLAKYDAAAPAAWPGAKQALVKILGPQSTEMMNTEMGPSLVKSMMAPMLAEEIKPKDCPAIDRVLTNIEPLPPRNAAALVVTLLQLSSGNKRDGKLPICPL
jgi:hypothetical protein